MRELPRRALTDTDLETFARRRRIRGVFMRNAFARMKPRTNECAVVNLDSSSGPGTHWVAYVKRGDRVLYYDSFGDLPPPRELKRYFAGSSIEYNFGAEQTYGTYVCGHRCLEFLIKATVGLARR